MPTQVPQRYTEVSTSWTEVVIYVLCEVVHYRHNSKTQIAANTQKNRYPQCCFEIHLVWPLLTDSAHCACHLTFRLMFDALSVMHPLMSTGAWHSLVLSYLPFHHYLLEIIVGIAFHMN